MGGLIPNPHDDVVKQKLDRQFRDPRLHNLRKRIAHPPTEPHFFSDPGHQRHLYRISYRLKIWPHPVKGEPPPTLAELKARWQYFLRNLLTDPMTAAQKGTTVAAVIRHALQVFVVDDDPSSVAAGAANCTAITFDAVPDDGTLPPGINYRADIIPDPYSPRPPGPYVASIILMCRIEIPGGVGAPDPGSDPGEVPPAQPSFFVKPKTKPKKRPKKRSAKKSKKKKKAVKNVSKNATKKSAKKAVKTAKRTGKK
jgi:hypothetical protein